LTPGKRSNTRAAQEITSPRRPTQDLRHNLDRLVVHIGEAQAGVESVDPVRDGGQDRVETPPLGQIAHDRRQCERLASLWIVHAEPVIRDRDAIARLEVLQGELPRLTAVSADVGQVLADDPLALLGHEELRDRGGPHRFHRVEADHATAGVVEEQGAPL